MSLEAGYAFFAEDESTLHRLNEELADANEILSMENELLVRERELTEEKAAIEERSALYTRAARAVYPAQKRISELLGQMQTGLTFITGITNGTRTVTCSMS
ncbi:MAG: hypothetical protein IKG82_10800 [Oscillospiraceae bacterium]|nr:hypothetical protein [Oscillospiraceae bacterium]